MATGATDEVVASTLDTSPRTIRRRIAAIAERLHVQGRFALGLALGQCGIYANTISESGVMNS